MPPRADSSIIVKTLIVLVGWSAGLYLGAQFGLKDYQIVQYTPPEVDDQGHRKPVPFKLTFTDVTPLELKPELKERREKLLMERLKGEELEKLRLERAAVSKSNS